MKTETSAESALRLLPSVDALLKTETAKNLLSETGAKQLTELARRTIENLRRHLRETANGGADFSRAALLESAEQLLQQEFKSERQKAFQRVINATGVIIHTNLGRAALAAAAVKAIAEEAARYCTLEYDLETGRRGKRGKQVEELLCELTGAECALVVNNCAAAAFLTLSALASGGEAVISRGELVEIGGDFRVPDVMAQSGTKLVEVGTTNRTKLKDYENAMTENTKILMRVHPSNYRIVGFTETPDLKDLAALAQQNDLLLYEDAGSGALVDLSRFGLGDEPLISESIKAGADVVTFSGDKLLGSVQAGIIVGKRDAVEKLRRHPLYRALRVDKLAYAALAATLEIYRRETHLTEIPVLRMLAQTKDEIAERSRYLIQKLTQSGISNFEFEIIAGNSAIGGGSAPLVNPPTALISLRHKALSTDELERALRTQALPIIGRVADDRFLLDLRTVFADEDDEIISALHEISAKTKD